MLNLLILYVFFSSERELADLRTEVQEKRHVEELENCVFSQSSEEEEK